MVTLYRSLGHLSSYKILEDLRELRYVEGIRYLRELQYLRELLLTNEVAGKTIERASVDEGRVARVDYRWVQGECESERRADEVPTREVV